MSNEIFIRKGIVIDLHQSYSTLATWEWHLKTDILLCSEALLNIFNINIDKRFLTIEEQTALFPYESLKKLVIAFQECISSQQAFEIEINVNKAGLGERNCLLYAHPNFDENNELISVNGTLKDISKTKADRAILKEVQQYHQQLVEASNEGLFLLDSNTHDIIDVNNTTENITGYTKDELKKLSFLSLCSAHSDLKPDIVKSYLRKAIIDDMPQMFECLIKTHSGEDIWLELYAKYIDINNLERVIVSARDISFRKRDEKKTLSNELRQKFLINISLFNAQNLNELLDFILGEILKNTNSTLGYISYHNTSNSSILVKNLKDRFEPLNEAELNTFKLIEDKSFWSDIVLLRKPIIDNAFDISHHLKGVYKGGDIQRLNYLSIPIFKAQKIVASIGVVNSKRKYTQKDVDELTFFMDTVWDVVEAKEFSDKSIGDTDIYLSAIKQSPLIIEQYNKDGLQISANEAYEKLWGFPASTTINSFNILKSIEIKNSILYDYVKQAYSGLSVITPDYEYYTSAISGQKIWFSTRIYPVFNALGEIDGITITHDDVSQRKEIELKTAAKSAAIEHHNQLLNAIFERLPLRVFWKNEDGIYLGCNTLFAKDTGYNTVEEVLGKTDNELKWERNLQKLRSRDFECFKANAVFDGIEQSYTTPEGREVFLKTSLLPLKNIDNSKSGILGIYDDITLAKQNEKALLTRIEKSKEKHFSLSDLIAIKNLEDIYAYVSEALYKELTDSIVVFTSVNQSETKLTVKSIQGLSTEHKQQIQSVTNYNIQGKNLSVYPSNYEIYKKGKVVEFSGGLDLYFGIQFPSTEARKIEHLLGISNIYTLGVNHDDKLLGVVHVFSKRNIDPDKKSIIESIAKQSAFVLERRSLVSNDTITLDLIYKTIETASDAILITEAKSGIVAAANTRSEYMFNREIEDLVGFHYSILFPKERRDEYEKTFGLAIKTNEPTNGEFWIEDKNGQQIPVIISTSFINSNNKIYVMLIFHDIVKRKEAEALVELKNTELKQHITTKDKLFSIISHDLKNPLTGIVGFAEVVKDELPEDSDGQLIKFMDIIIRSADSMVYLINNLLHWSRIQQGAIQPKFNKIKIYDVAEREFELLFTAANNKKIDLINAIDFDTLAYGDGEMISTVIRNLVSNAIKFTPNEGSVTVSSSEDESLIKISIADTGVGMPKDVAEKLFQINNEIQRNGTAGEKGTGLGLVICKDFVEQNNGKIWVESTIDVGTTFYFTVPKFSE